MKNLASLILLMCLAPIGLHAQDLLILKDGNQIPCKILTKDSTGYITYKYIGKSDPYTGEFKKAYYEEIIYDYYTDLRRNANPYQSLNYFTFAARPFYTAAINPFLNKVIISEDIEDQLLTSNGVKIGYHYFYNGKLDKLASNPIKGMVLGVNLGYVRSSFIGTRIQGSNFNVGWLFPNELKLNTPEVDTKVSKSIIDVAPAVSYVMGNKYLTTINFSPKVEILTYKYHLDDYDFKQTATMGALELGLEQGVVATEKILISVGASAQISRAKTSQIIQNEYVTSRGVSYPFDSEKFISLGAYVNVKYFK